MIDIYVAPLAPAIENLPPHRPRFPFTDRLAVEADDRAQTPGSRRRPGFISVHDIPGLDILFHEGTVHLSEDLCQDFQADSPQNIISSRRDNAAFRKITKLEPPVSVMLPSRSR